MKTEQEVKTALDTELKRRDQILAELNAAIGRIQALQAVLSSTPADDTPPPAAKDAAPD